MSEPDSPAVELRLRLERLRAQGRSFDVAWGRAVRGVTRRLHDFERREWARTFKSTRAVWEGAYQEKAAELTLMAA